MKKILVVISILLALTIIIIGIILIPDYVKQYQKERKIKLAKIRIQEIRKDVEKELPDYIHLISPLHCDKGGHIRVNSLINNRGMDRSVFLDTDGKTLCKVNIYTKCDENDQQSWDIKVGCKDYQEDGFVDWGY